MYRHKVTWAYWNNEFIRALEKKENLYFYIFIALLFAYFIERCFHDYKLSLNKKTIYIVRDDTLKYLSIWWEWEITTVQGLGISGELGIWELPLLTTLLKLNLEPIYMVQTDAIEGIAHGHWIHQVMIFKSSQFSALYRTRFFKPKNKETQRRPEEQHNVTKWLENVTFKTWNY